MDAPKVFISYSHDSNDHKAWVLRLAEQLRKHCVDASLDQWDLVPGQDVAAFMHSGITNCDRVLLICTDNYVMKAESGLGGVGYERLIVTADVIQNIDTKKFIPIVRDNTQEFKVPRFMGPRLYLDFSDDATYDARFEDLLRELLGAPALVKPPLGSNPFSGQPGLPAEPLRQAGPTGVTSTGTRVLSEDWFQQEAAIAEKGLAAVGLTGCMELRFGLHDQINKSQIELLNSVRKSEIHTFGWPIAITLDNRDEYRPRPYGDGIRAEISLEKSSSMFGRETYDYWALRSNGDFYLLQSLFEDDRAENAIFFNTRIVRVTEALLFAFNLYSDLGVAPETRLSVRVTHRGLAGRVLGSTGSRSVFPRTTQEKESLVEIVVPVGKIKEQLVQEVQRITQPLFMLFDFAEFGPQIYEDIVRRFENGEVS